MTRRPHGQGRKMTSDKESRSFLCGLGSWRPKWLQVFTGAQFFLINLSFIALIHGSYFTYLLGVASTIEKRFSYSAKLMATIFIAKACSKMLVSPVIGFLGKKMNRSTLIGCGMVLASVSCWLMALPHFIYGPANERQEKLSLTIDSLNRSIELCGSRPRLECTETDSPSTTVWPAYLILFSASLLNGVGDAIFSTLGLPYLDDNVSKESAPMYLSLLYMLRFVGPTGGFLLVSVCLSTQKDPLSDEHSDLIGPWWLGFMIIGSLIFISSLPLFLFPKNLKSSRVDSEERGGKRKGLTVTLIEAKTSFLRIFQNPLWLCHTIAGITRFIGYFGFYFTLPKYLQSQYELEASVASRVTGMYLLLAMTLGTAIGGIFIRRVRPAPRILTSLIFAVEFASMAAMLLGLLFGCPKHHFASDNNLIDSCNSNCGCSHHVLEPHCSADGKTNYMSPCFAGCSESIDGKFVNCTCERTLPIMSNTTSYLTKGKCPVECDNFTMYIVILAIGNIIASTSRTGNVIVGFRSIEERDKTFAMGISLTMYGMFGSIPYPLIFSAITDAACLVWEEGCGSRGACRVYDSNKFRTYLHLTTLFFMTVASAFDILVIYYSKRMSNLYDDLSAIGGEPLSLDGAVNKDAIASTIGDVDKVKRREQVSTL